MAFRDGNWVGGDVFGDGKLEKTRFDVTLLEQEGWKA